MRHDMREGCADSRLPSAVSGANWALMMYEVPAGCAIASWKRQPAHEAPTKRPRAGVGHRSKSASQPTGLHEAPAGGHRAEPATTHGAPTRRPRAAPGRDPDNQVQLFLNPGNNP